MVLNTIVSIIGCAVVIFIHTNQPEEHAFLDWPLWQFYPGRQDRNIIYVKKGFKTNLYMGNTKCDVALMNISRQKERQFFDLVQYPK